MRLTEVETPTLNVGATTLWPQVLGKVRKERTS